jgi:putative transcriptional regulator
MVAGYVVFAAAGTLNRYTKEINVAKPGSLLLGPALAANGLPWHGGQPANRPGRSNWANAVRTESELPPAVFVPVQSKDAKHLGVGKLLVASRNLADPNFAKTVILLIRSDDQGIVGLILNRRTDLPLSRVLEGLQGTKDRSDPAYLGGPVQVPAVTALLQSPTNVEGADHIFGGVYLINTKTILEQTLAARPDPQVFHVYLGYAGWTNDQLRKELELGAWFIFPADTDSVFNSYPGSLWTQMIRKTEQKLAESEPTSRDPWTRACPVSSVDACAQFWF